MCENFLMAITKAGEHNNSRFRIHPVCSRYLGVSCSNLLLQRFGQLLLLEHFVFLLLAISLYECANLVAQWRRTDAQALLLRIFCDPSQLIYFLLDCRCPNCFYVLLFRISQVLDISLVRVQYVDRLGEPQHFREPLFSFRFHDVVATRVALLLGRVEKRLELSRSECIQRMVVIAIGNQT